MGQYRLQIWSGRQDGLVDHGAIATGKATGELLLERIHAAGRAALSLASCARCAPAGRDRGAERSDQGGAVAAGWPRQPALRAPSGKA